MRLQIAAAGIRLALLVVAAVLAAVAPACWEREEGRESQNGGEIDWDFQRTVTVALSVAEPLRPASGTARVEVRHTIYGGRLLFEGVLDDEGGWTRTFSARLPQHEEALTVTVETAEGLVRHVVPIDDDGRAGTSFE